MPANDPIIYKVSSDGLRVEPLVGSGAIVSSIAASGSVWPAASLPAATSETQGAVLLGGPNPAAAATVQQLSTVENSIVKPTDIFSLRLSQNISLADWAKGAKMITVRTDSPVVTVRSTTGYARGLRWDGTWTAVGGTGVAGNNITINWGTAPASPYNTRLPKFIAVFPTNNVGSITGDLTYLDCTNNQFTSLDVSGLTALTSLFCQANQLTTLDVSGCTALTYLDCSGNQLTTLDVSGCTALTYLDCQTNQLTTLDVSGLTAFTYLNCSINQLTTLDASGLTALAHLECNFNQLTTLDVSGCTALTRLDCHYNQLTMLDVSGLTALTRLDCPNNQLNTLRCVGCLGADYTSYAGWDWANNDLSGPALNQAYADLGTARVTGSQIDVTGNPGTASDDPTIATAKGYVVVGT